MIEGDLCGELGVDPLASSCGGMLIKMIARRLREQPSIPKQPSTRLNASLAWSRLLLTCDEDDEVDWGRVSTSDQP